MHTLYTANLFLCCGKVAGYEVDTAQVLICIHGRRRQGGRGGSSRPTFCAFHLTLTAQHHIIMAYARTRVRTIGMQTARKTAGADSVSLLI